MTPIFLPIVTRSSKVRISVFLLAAHASAEAGGLQKVNTTMETIQTMLIGIAVVTLTIAIIWAGFKMIFGHARWSDISNIVIGGILIGGAAAIAGWLAGTA